jgi:hypothetical protein
VCRNITKTSRQNLCPAISYGSLSAGLAKYGDGTTSYAPNILKTADELKKNPADPIAILQKYIGK